MRLALICLSALIIALPLSAQAKSNPFVDPPKQAEKPNQAKKNPFTDPDTKLDTAKPKSESEKPAVEVIETKEPVIVPMTRLPSGHFLVKVKLNGQGPYNLVFDTGAPFMLLNSRIGKAGKVTKGGGFSLFAGMNPENIAALEVGSCVAANVPAMVMDHPTVAAISDAFEADYGKIEGIVGFPFFARYAVTVDYQKSELRLAPNGYKPGDLIRDLTTRLTTMSGPQPTPVLAPAAAWGLTVDKKSDDKKAGVDITAVLDGSPASTAGLKAGDRLLTLDGRWTDSLSDTFRAVGFVKAGRKTVLEVERNSKVEKVMVTPVMGQ